MAAYLQSKSQDSQDCIETLPQKQKQQLCHDIDAAVPGDSWSRILPTSTFCEFILQF